RRRQPVLAPRLRGPSNHGPAAHQGQSLCAGSDRKSAGSPIFSCAHADSEHRGAAPLADRPPLERPGTLGFRSTAGSSVRSLTYSDNDRGNQRRFPEESRFVTYRNLTSECQGTLSSRKEACMTMSAHDTSRPSGIMPPNNNSMGQVTVVASDGAMTRPERESTVTPM